MIQIHETIKKVRANNLKIKRNEKALKEELEAIKSGVKDRKRFDKMVKESRSAIANIKLSMTYIQASGKTDIEDYLQIMNDLKNDEEKLNNVCNELKTYLKGE
jgi:aspartate ammonia-lyase